MKNFDIRPRSKAVKVSKPAVETSAIKNPSVRSRTYARIIAAVLVAAMVLFVLGYVFLPAAEVRVWARSEPVTRDVEIKLDKSLPEPDLATMSVPAISLDREVSGSKNFPASGSKNVGKSASGFVSIYNFSKTALVLKSQTTTLKV